MTRPQDLVGRRERIVSLRPMTVCRSIADKHAVLALVDGCLAAVLVRLDELRTPTGSGPAALDHANDVEPVP